VSLIYFDKIGVILKEIAHLRHFCNKILLLNMFKGNDLIFDLVGYVTNSLLNMKIKIEDYF